MRRAAVLVIAIVCSRALVAQEGKPVPQDSVRVFIPGCARGYVFTVGPRMVDQPGSFDLPEGFHLRMNGPKKVMAEIGARERSRIEITGIVKKDQLRPEGIALGGGVRVAPGSAPVAEGRSASPAASQVQIDVEGWRPIPGACGR